MLLTFTCYYPVLGIFISRDSSDNLVSGYSLISRVLFPAREGHFLLYTRSRTVRGFFQIPVQGVQWAFLLGVKRPQRKANHLLWCRIHYYLANLYFIYLLYFKPIFIYRLKGAESLRVTGDSLVK